MKPRQPRKGRPQPRTAWATVPKHYWPIGLSIVIALLGVLLIFLRASVTVKGELRVSRVSFESDNLDSERVFNRIETPRLTLERFATLELGRGWLEEAEAPPSSRQTDGTPQPSADITLIPVNPVSAAVTLEEVSVNQLALPKRATLILSWPDSEAAQSIQLEVRTAKGEEPVIGKLAAHHNPLLIACRDCTTAEGGTDETSARSWRFYAEPRQEVKFQGAATGLTMSFILDPDEPFKEKNIQVDRALEFVKAAGERGESTILGGTIEIADMQSKVTVSEGQVLKLGDFSSFRLEMVRIGQGIILEFAGRVGEFRSGSPGLAENRLPRYVELIYYRLPWMVWSVLGGLCWLVLEIWKILHEGKKKPA